MESPIFLSKPTKFTCRYGFFPSFGKSLLTPLTPFPSDHSLFSDGNVGAWKARHAIEEYQREVLHSYTTWILQELDAITERDLENSTLSNPILPCLRRSQWETRDNMATGKDAKPYVSDGASVGRKEDVVWLAENDLVWNELVPILRLASWILIKMSKTPWFDAMMMSERAEVSTHQFSADTLLNHLNEGIYQIQNELTQIKLRPLELVIKGEAESLLHVLMNEILLARMRISFSSETLNPYSREPYPKNRDTGNRIFGSCTDDGGRIILFLTYQQIAPLLNKHLNDAERLAERFGCATIIAHEMIVRDLQTGRKVYMTNDLDLWQHILNKAKVHYYDSIDKSNSQRDFEPYFENELEAELGFSSIANFFGGYADGFTKFIPVYNAPQMGFFLTSFPDYSAASSQPKLKILSKANPYIHISIPLPVTYYEILNSNDFWEQQVTAFGMINAPESMGGSAFIQPRGWRIIQRDEDYFAKQTKILLTKLESYKTPYARHESALTILHWGKVFHYYLLIGNVEAKVREVMDESEWLIKSSRNNYEGFSSDLAGMIDGMKDLLTIHEKLIKFIPKMDKYAEEASLHHRTPDGRNTARSFHRAFLRFLHSLTLTKVPEFEMKFHKIIARLESLGKEVDFLDSITISESNKTNEQSELQMMKQIQEASIKASESEDSDQSPCAKFCDAVLGNLGYSLYSQAQARIFKSKLGTTGILEEIALLRRASETFDLVHDGIIPVPSAWDESEMASLEAYIRGTMKRYEGMFMELRVKLEEKHSVNTQICYTRDLV